MCGEYDFLIVGAGLYGAVFAREMTDAGYKCMVIDRRKHTGGNVYCERIEGIHVHRYGPHIFHTNDRGIWEYVNALAPFTPFVYSPLASYKQALYHLPFNMHTFYQLWGVTTAEEAAAVIQQQITAAGIRHIPANLEEQAIARVGTEVYQKLIKGYTEKQWGRKPSELPASIINRMCVRFTYDNNYFNDTYQGIPVGGYNSLIAALLKGIEVKTGVDYLQSRGEWNEKAKQVVYSGSIDEFYGYCFGCLEYRSLSFEDKILPVRDYQGVAVVNYTDAAVPYTRVIEHKHFEWAEQAHTVVTYETPQTWEKGREAFYPVNDAFNNCRYKQYRQLAATDAKMHFGGRLAEYRYYDMHQVIASALKASRNFIGLI